MTMENQEEILLLLERFTKSKQKDIPRELEDYLNFVARTGDTLYRWVLVKPLFREKLVNVITDFHHNTPSIADIPQCPNVDPFNFERMKRALLDRLDSFNSAPFTVQRICELLTEPRKQYTRIDKFMRAVEKNILVVSTQEPGRRRSDSENGDSLDSIVNGDLEVNVDIEMDNEQFHLEADALLPDSSEHPVVGSLHNSLTTAAAGEVGSPERPGASNELNGGAVPCVVGAFMGSDDDDNQSPTAKGDLLNAATEHRPGVIDTNENATDGDIAAPLLESSRARSPPTTTATTTTDSSERSEKKGDTLDEKQPTKDSSSMEDDKVGTDETTTVRSEPMTEATDPIAPPMEKTSNPDDATAPETAVPADGDAADESKSRPLSSSSVETDGETEDSPAVDDDGEPHAKMGKYDVSPKTETTESTNTVAKLDVTHSTTPEKDQELDQKCVPASQDTDRTPDVNDSDKAGPTVASSGSERDGSVEASSVAVDLPADAHRPADEEHSKPESNVPEATSVPEPTAQQALGETSDQPTGVGATEAPPPINQATKLELELTTIVAPPAVPAETVMEEVDMVGAEPVGTEMADDDTTKPDDNVMDIDESSVEMMDQ